MRMGNLTFATRSIFFLIIAIAIANFIHAQSSDSGSSDAGCASQTSETCNDLQCKWSYPTCSDFACSVRQNFNCYDPAFTFRQAQTMPIPTGLDRTCFWASDPANSNGGSCLFCSSYYQPCPTGCMSPAAGGGDPGGPGGPSLCIRSCQYTIPGPSTCDVNSLCQTDTTQSATNSAMWVCRDKNLCSGMPRQNCSSVYCDWDTVTKSCAVNTCASRLNQVACETKSVYDNVRCQWDASSLGNGKSRCVETVDCSAFTSDRSLCNSKPCCGMLDDPSNPSNSVCSVMCSCLMSSSNCLSGAAATYCTWRSGSSSSSPSYCTPNGVATCSLATTKIRCYNAQSPSDQAYSCHWFTQAELPPASSSAYATTVSTSSQCLMLPCFLRTYEQCLTKSANDDATVLECFTYNTSTGAMKCGGCSRSRTTNPAQTISESSAGFPCDWDPACELDTLSQQCRRRCATYGTNRQQCDGERTCSFDAAYTSQISYTRRELGSGVAPVAESLITNCYKALVPCPMYLRSPFGTPSEACVVGSGGYCQDYPAVAPYSSSENCLQVCSIFNANKTSGAPARRAKCVAAPECRWSTSSNSCVDACWRAVFAEADAKNSCQDSECQWTDTTTVSSFSSYITDINVNCYPLPICNRYGSNQTACQSAAQMYLDGGNISQCEWKSTSDVLSAATGLCTIKCNFIISETICSKGQGGWCRWNNMTSSCVPSTPASVTTTTTTTKSAMITTTTTQQQQVTGNTNSNTATSNAVTQTTNGQTTILSQTTSTTNNNNAQSTTRVSTTSAMPKTTTTTTTATTKNSQNQQSTSSNPNISPSTSQSSASTNNNPGTSTTTTITTATTFPPATKPQTTVTVTLNQTKLYNSTQLQSQLAADLGISADSIALTQINSTSIQITFVNTAGSNSSLLVQKLSNFSSSQLEKLGLVNALAAPGESWTTTLGPTPTPEAKSDGKSNAGLLGAVIGGTLAFFVISFVAYRYIKKNRKGGARSGDGDENGGDEEFGVSASKAFQIDFDQDDADFANPFESPQQGAPKNKNNGNNATKRATTGNNIRKNAFDAAPISENMINNATAKPKKPRRRSEFDQFGDDI